MSGVRKRLLGKSKRAKRKTHSFFGQGHANQNPIRDDSGPSEDNTKEKRAAQFCANTTTDAKLRTSSKRGRLVCALILLVRDVTRCRSGTLFLFFFVGLSVKTGPLFASASAIKETRRKSTKRKQWNQSFFPFSLPSTLHFGELFTTLLIIGLGACFETTKILEHFFCY